MATKYVGGDITEIVCSHPTLGDFRFQAKSNEAFTVDFGGIRNNDDANSVTGSGQLIQQKNRVGWSVEGTIVNDYKSGNENENLPKLAESSDPAVWTFSHISGVVWKGTGVIVGDFNTDTNAASSPLKVFGGGKLEKL